MDGKAGLRIANSNQKAKNFSTGSRLPSFNGKEVFKYDALFHQG